jgi:two-component system CheB/CheR fusion protein
VSEETERLNQLLEYLKEQRGFDFSGYKRASLSRRVRRRMDVVGLGSYEDYQDYLEVHPNEFTALFNTILINVTGFFRDSDTWEFLRSDLLPGLLSRREGEPIRVWCAGCASGEEAYSLAMVLAEALGAEEFRERVKIYATDVDEDALGAARQASYSADDMGGVAADLREKYFDAADERYIFRKEIRRSVIFGRNDLVQDAPISHVDLLSCRNTLMYFTAEAQGRILSRMHFALRSDGLLFLGKAEMLLNHGGLFEPADFKRRFFRKVPGGPRDRLGAGGGGLAQVPPDGFYRVREEALLSSAGAQVVLDGQGRLAFFNHRASTLFGLSTRDIGRPIQDLELSYRPVEVRAHIEQAMVERRAVWVREVSWVRAGAEPILFDVQIVPLRDDAGGPLGATVIFNDVTQYRQLQTELEFANRQLETAYEELQSTNEELETTNEELQSTVEELETTNEELQSTNEELETMNEELQSMNDELHISNDSLREHQDQVDNLNAFLSGILGSIPAGVAVVDANLEVLAWNPQMEDLWGVRAEESIGQHLSNLDIGLPVEELRPLLRNQVSGDGKSHELTTVQAVNRRGRSVAVEVTITHFERGAESGGAILVMNVVDGEAASQARRGT